MHTGARFAKWGLGLFIFGGFLTFGYSPVVAGKNIWLLGQAFFIAVYFAGTILEFDTVRRALNAIPVGA